ncbi:MAG: hypothetical protein AAGJ29_09295 [Pseudomonadota bacterium]
MTLRSKVVGLTLCALLLAGCSSTPSQSISRINDLKETISLAGAQTETEAALLRELADAESQLQTEQPSTELKLAWTIAALNAADALTMLPETGEQKLGTAYAKAFSYADDASELCLADGGRNVDSRSGNLCSLAFALRRLSNTRSAVRAFERSAQEGNWQSAAEHAKSFDTEVSVSWPGYQTDLQVLSNSAQDSLDFKGLASLEICKLQRAQSGVGLMRAIELSQAMIKAQNAYLDAVFEGARFTSQIAKSSACAADETSRQCLIDTEAAIGRDC